MYLVQAVLPLSDNEGNAFPREAFEGVVAELTRHFGGATAYTRAPAEGIWAEGGRATREDVIVIEVMVDGIDTGWWTRFRRDLERRFRQREVLLRAIPAQVL